MKTNKTSAELPAITLEANAIVVQLPMQALDALNEQTQDKILTLITTDEACLTKPLKEHVLRAQQNALYTQDGEHFVHTLMVNGVKLIFTGKAFDPNGLSHLPQTNRFYTPRPEHERHIHRSFEIHQEKNHELCIAGPPGIGKTQLALNYAHTHQNTYAFVRFIRSQYAELEANYRLFAHALCITDKTLSIHEVREKLCARLRKLVGDRRTLFIFDNVEDTDALKPYIDSLPDQTDIIITTRNCHLPQSLVINTFSERQATAYLCNALVRSNKLALIPASSDFKTAVKSHTEANNWAAILSQFPDVVNTFSTFIHTLSRYPLALTHALAFCSNLDVTLDQFNQQITKLLPEVIIGQDEFGNDCLDHEVSFFDEQLLGDVGLRHEYDQSLYSCFRHTFDQIREHFKSSGEDKTHSEQKACMHDLLCQYGILKQGNESSIIFHSPLIRSVVEQLAERGCFKSNKSISTLCASSIGKLLANQCNIGTERYSNNALPTDLTTAPT